MYIARLLQLKMFVCIYQRGNKWLSGFSKMPLDSLAKW